MNLNTARLLINNQVRDFHYRGDSVGDKGVIGQIFQNREYDFTRWPQGRRLVEFHRDRCRAAPSLIVDAGANIGASAVFFLNLLSDVFVYSVEPNRANWQICELNTADYPNKFNFHGAIARRDGELLLVDPGESDWGFRTRPKHEATSGVPVRAIRPDSILDDLRVRGMTPLIFKIDIEGAEQDLFSGDTDWLDRFAMVTIELHDWMLPFSGASKPFLQAIAKLDFDICQAGENLFLFNRRLLA